MSQFKPSESTDEELEALLRSMDELERKIGRSVPLPTDPGLYRVEPTEVNRAKVASLSERGWSLGGDRISSEGLRRYLESYKLKLEKIEREN